jgi:hypothetical protein
MQSVLGKCRWKKMPAHTTDSENKIHSDFRRWLLVFLLCYWASRFQVTTRGIGCSYGLEIFFFITSTKVLEWHLENNPRWTSQHIMTSINRHTKSQQNPDIFIHDEILFHTRTVMARIIWYPDVGAASSGNPLQTFRGHVSVPSSRVKKSCPQPRK